MAVKSQKPRIIVKCAIIILFALCLLASDDSFVMISGSDSASFLVGPAISVQMGCFLVFSAALLTARRGLVLVLRVAVAVCAVLIGAHRLVVDNNRYELRDVYLLVSVQSIALSPGDENGLAMQYSELGFTIHQRPDGTGIWCFSPGPLGLSRNEVQRLDGM